MQQSTGPLSPCNQGARFGEWEWRGDAIWLHGAIQSNDIRLRYVQVFPDIAMPGIDFSTTYIPVLDCQDCIADKIAVRYTRRLGGDALEDVKDQAKKSLFQLRQQMARNRQLIDVTRPSYGQFKASGGGYSGYLY
jgi:hypothetical protein